MNFALKPWSLRRRADSSVPVFRYEGITDEPVKRRLTVRQLLGTIPFVAETRALPPRHLLNQLFQKGRTKDGENGRLSWQPFSIDEGTYRAFLKGKNGVAFSGTEPPNWVTSLSDWLVWMVEARHGIPAQEHKTLRDELAHLEQAENHARESGDQAGALNHHIGVIEARTRLGDFLAENLAQPTRT